MPGSLPSTGGGPIILLVNKADGDEEVLTYIQPHRDSYHHTKDYLITFF